MKGTISMFGLTVLKEKAMRDQDLSDSVRVAHSADSERSMDGEQAADIARDFARVHSVITYALCVAVERSQRYALDGYPNRITRKGFVLYVRCMSALLYAHHSTEDDLAFPYFWERLPELPVERLIAQHQQMDPLLDDIRTELSSLAGKSQESERLVRLNHALAEMTALWQAHIEIEERYLTSERIRTVIDPAEQARIRRRFTDHSRRLLRRTAPLSLLIPFVLYNLTQEERSGLAPKMARIVTRVLIPHVWRKRWLPMAPFMREPPEH